MFAIFWERPGRALSGEIRPPPPPPDSMSKNPIESVSLLRMWVRADARAFDTSSGVLVLVFAVVLLMLCTDLVLDGRRNAEEQGAVAKRLAMQRDDRRVKRSIDPNVYFAISVFMRNVEIWFPDTIDDCCVDSIEVKSSVVLCVVAV